MAMEWAPSVWGRTLTSSTDWRLHLQGLELRLEIGGRVHKLDVENEGSYLVRPGVFWTDFTAFPGTPQEMKADGLPNARGATLLRAIERALQDKRIREDLTHARRAHKAMREWLEERSRQEQGAAAQHRWFTHDMQAALAATRPAVDITRLRALLQKTEVKARLGGEAAELERHLALWDADQAEYWARFNAAHTQRELQACKGLLDRVERQPLTDEQARAVVCFDNRVQVVASAGSGKTSTMVAKAAYAIHRRLVAPERMVLLAFNKQAAEELKERAAQAFERLGMGDTKVEASTFHALGLRIIGKATGERPDIPDWATDTGRGHRKLSEIIDQLKDRLPAFRVQWDLFRFVFKRDLPAFGAPEPADVWDAEGASGLRTANGEVVKSQEEAMIADWLFLNGVDYRYEHRYAFKTADEDHRQYKPDFYYPTIDLYHEHLALDAQGRAPVHFAGYMEGVAWKREKHRQMGTDLFETTSHGLREGKDLQRLEAALVERGVVLDPNPDRPIPEGGQKPLESKELVALIRTFISHVKSNALSIGALRARLDALPNSAFKPRYRMFLELAAPILEAWDAALAAEGGIDFEDMLNLAAEHLESGRYDAGYELVMADEFQDASRARARLCRALVQKPNRYLFAVGDDWQSINRFAGADVAVMTRFREWFGHGQVLKLEQTFRCPQALCDVSSAFVSKNPAQIRKHVRSVAPAVGSTLQAFQVDHKDKLADAVDRFVMQLAEGVRSGSIPPGRNGKVSVFVLGRYNADQQYVPARRSRFERFVHVSFLTIHRSKGSEADYVILPEMLSVSRGRSFPSTRADDPVLALAMPDSDAFPLGEERRLFYVALTRARRSVAMFTARGRCSRFLKELEEDGAVVITDTDGKVVREESCPACEQGVMVMRAGPHGKFRCCSNYPDCRYKPGRRHHARARSTNRFYQPGVDPFRSTGGFQFPAAPPRPRATIAPSQPSFPVTPAPFPSSVPRPQTQAAPSATKVSLDAILKTIHDGATELSRNVDRQRLIQISTSELELDVHNERATIEAALAMAAKSRELREQLKDPAFRAAYEELRGLIHPSSSADANAMAPPVRSVPDFGHVPSHDEPAISLAIEKKVTGLKLQREAFLADVHARLSADTVLYGFFRQHLLELGGEHYLNALDPKSSLKAASGES